MPVSKSGKFFYLNYGEKAHIRLLSLGEERIENGKLVRYLSTPHFMHISDKVFRGTNRKAVMCAGLRCEFCSGGLVPAKFFRVKIQLIGEEHGKYNGAELLFDMPASCHKAMTTAIQNLISDNVPEEEILNTVFVVERLLGNRRPWFTCEVSDRAPIIANTEDDMNISEEDKAVLQKLLDVMKKKVFHNPKKALINTLRQKYGWSEAKIEVALATELANINFEDFYDAEKDSAEGGNSL